MASYDCTFKIMVLGDADTKTSLLIRYISGFFLDDLKLTIGVDFYSKTTLYKGKKVKLQLWPFGGEKRFKFLLHHYIKGANAALFLYNITNPNTLDHLPDWIGIVREHAGDIPIILVGAKVHLEELRAVSREEGILAAKKYNLSGFAEISSKTGQNVEKVFELIIAILLEKTFLNVNKRRLKPKKVGKKRKIIELEKEKQREQSLSREAVKLIQEGTQLKDKTPKEKSLGMYDAILFKIVIFGDSGCGKNSLVQRFLTNLFVSDSDVEISDTIMTIGVDFKLKDLTVDGQKVMFQILDFSGEERFRYFIPQFITGARGGIFVYDITNFLSIAHIDDWLSVIRKKIKAEDMFPIIIVGNRAHLVDQREVSSVEGIRIAKSRGLNGFIEVSAKTGENVEKAFEELTRLMLSDTGPRKVRVRPANTDRNGLEQDPEFQGLIEKKIRRVLELEKEKQREKSLSRAFKLPIKTFMNQDLKQWLETLKGLKKGCEEIIEFLKDKNKQYYYHLSFEHWKYLLTLSSELLEEFKQNSSSFYKMSDDTKRKLYRLFEIFIPCREILSDGSFGKNVRVTFEEYLKILKLEKEIHK